MVPLIVIAAIVAIIIIIKKMFDTSENTGSSSSHYTSSGNTSQSSPPVSNNKHTAKPSRSSYDIDHAQYLLKQLNESANIVNHTTNPKTYFGRLNFIFDTLMEMTKYEKSGIYKGSSPTQNLNKLKNDLESSVNAFIDRAYEAQLEKVCNLKTNQGKINNLNKFFDSMFAAFERANTFWSGDSLKPHYTGALYTSKNLDYLNTLYKDCIKLHNLEPEADIPNECKKVKSSNAKKIVDKPKEKILLSEHQEYKNVLSNHADISQVSAIEQAQICDTDEVTTAQRKEICNNIILNFSESSDSLDCLAVAIAHKHLGATHRKQAIKYYEMYLEKPVRIPNKTELQWNAENWMIHSDLAKLYESEYEYDKSIHMLEECILLNKKVVQLSGYGFNPADYTRIGTLIMKRDGTAAAIAYYEELKNSEVYNKDKSWFDDAYNDVIDKHNRGYVYRSRKAKKQ